jgi:hypothetical protein
MAEVADHRSTPAWRARTPDVVDSPSDHSETEVAEQLRPHNHSQTGGATASAFDISDGFRATTGRPRPSPGAEAARVTDPRSSALRDGAAELSLLLGAKEQALSDAGRERERLQAALADAEQRAAHMAGLVERERGRHAGDHIRTSDLEAEVERLTRRLHTQAQEAREREDGLRTAQTKLAEAKSTYERVDAERVAGARSERQRASLCEDRLAVQAEEVHRLETLLAATMKSREDLVKRLREQDAEHEKLRVRLHASQRDYDDYQARVQSGALVAVSELYAAQSDSQRFKTRAEIAEGNCERLLKIIAETADFGQLVKEDLLGLGFVYVGETERESPSVEGGLGLSGGYSSRPQQRRRIDSSTATTLRGIVASVNDSRRSVPWRPGPRGRNAERPAVGVPSAAATPLVSVDREHTYWIPREAYDCAESFRQRHLPVDLSAACFHQFFVDMNKVWRQRLEGKMKAMEHIIEQEVAGRVTDAAERRAGGGPSRSRPRTARAGWGDRCRSRSGGVVIDRDASSERVDRVRAASADSHGRSPTGTPVEVALRAEATAIESALEDALGVIGRIHRRSAPPRSIDGVLSELVRLLERAARVHVRAANELASSTHRGLNHSGDQDNADVHEATVHVAREAIDALRSAALSLKEAAGDPADYALKLRECVRQGRAAPDRINGVKCLAVIDQAGDTVALYADALLETAAALEARAGRLSTIPSDRAAFEAMRHRHLVYA